MRVIILGIDGLEYDLVTKWRLKRIMQEYYGKHDVTVAVRKGESLYTPLIWASFLLGKPSYEFGFTFEYIESKRIEYGYSSPLRILYRLRRKVLGKRKLGVRNLLAKMGLFNTSRISSVIEEFETLPKDALVHTFVSKAEERGLKIWRTSFPGLPGDEFAKTRAELSKHFNSSFEQRIKILDQVENKTVELFENMIKEARNYDLVLYYTPLIDDAHHMIYRPGNLKLMTRLRKYYSTIEKIVYETRARYGEDTAILVVSDHGYDPKIHEHSNHGFWSLNRKPPFTPKTILDFRKIVEYFLYNQ